MKRANKKGSKFSKDLMVVKCLKCAVTYKYL